MTVETVPPSPGAARRAAMLRALDDSGPATARALAPALRLTEQQARESLSWLEGASLVVHQAGPSPSGRGLAYTWSVTDEGRERRQGCAPWAASPCFRVIAGAATSGAAETHEIQRLLGEPYGGPCPLPLVEDGLAWLADSAHAAIAPAGRGRWVLTRLGRAAAAVSEDEDVPAQLRLRIAQGPGIRRAGDEHGAGGRHPRLRRRRTRLGSEARRAPPVLVRHRRRVQRPRDQMGARPGCRAVGVPGPRPEGRPASPDQGDQDRRPCPARLPGPGRCRAG